MTAGGRWNTPTPTLPARWREKKGKLTEFLFAREGKKNQNDSLIKG